MWPGHPLIVLVSAVCLLALAASASVAQAGGDARLRTELEAVARRSVFFGHQSVGDNILAGVRELAQGEGVELRIVEQPAAGTGRVWAHVHLPENGNPLLKLQNFERTLGTGPGPDVALLKFCYVDFHRGTDPAALFARYQATFRQLQARFPATAFVHVTAPLTTVQGGVKALVKRLLGREGSLEQNARRQQFNALMRQAYEGREPLFDLARVESLGPEGRARSVAWRGEQVPVLAEAYTADGGHLNPEGRQRVARELLSFLAAVPSGSK